MSRPVKDIRLAFQCPVKWDQMSPSANGRHCEFCSKEVVDFTNKTREEFQFIAFEKQGDLCGRFKTKQLAEPVSGSVWKRMAASLALLAGPFSFHLLAQTNTTSPEKPDTVHETEILGNVSYEMPTYKGGIDSLKSFLNRNIHYKEGSPVGKVFASFYVDKSGKVSEVKILKGLSKEIDAEVKRAVEMLQFEPVNYYPEGRIKYNLPVSFGTDCKKESAH